jgi:formate hydrogenlyase transcriptional activator
VRAWAAAARFRSMCGSSRRPTRSCGTWCRGRKFRADIYFRLNVFPILLPPLRERKDDILPLEDYFVQKFARQQGKSIDHITDEAIELLTCLDWPRNIRELQNVIERAVIITSGSVLDLHMTELMKHGASITANKTLADAERAHILATLNETNWVVGGRRGAAMQLGLRRTTLITMMQRHGISRGKSEQQEVRSDPAFATAWREHSSRSRRPQPHR